MIPFVSFVSIKKNMLYLSKVKSMWMSLMKTLRPSEIAVYCDVHQRTVSRWIASGQLKGFKLPGRGNYRVLLADFLQFLQAQQMPMPPALLQAESGVAPAGRVLVIDDEPLYRHAIRRLLQSKGYLVAEAGDGFQAGVQLGLFLPAVVTLDLKMPGLDGFEVLRYIRQQPAFQHVHVIVISGLATQALQEALSLGAVAALQKPFDNQQLLDVLQNLTAS